MKSYLQIIKYSGTFLTSYSSEDIEIIYKTMRRYQQNKLCLSFDMNKGMYVHMMLLDLLELSIGYMKHLHF